MPILCRKFSESTKTEAQLKYLNRREGMDSQDESDTAKKQSKKNQRKFHAAKRGSWNGVSPITRVVQSKRIYDRNRAKQESRQSGDRWQNRADRTKFHKTHNIFFGCTVATSSMKQQAPKILPKKAETIENTRKTADILIGAACHRKLWNLTVSPHRYTMCHGGTVGTGKSTTQTQMHEFASCYFT